MKQTVVKVFFILVISSIVLMAAASAAQNGRVAYASYTFGNYDLYTVNSNGDYNSIWWIAHGPKAETDPCWSPDGKKIAYVYDYRFIHIEDADGSGVSGHDTYLTDGDNPSWSPDGTRIAFDDKDGNIWIINPDGTGLTDISLDDSAVDSYPAWSPDGTKIAFSNAGQLWLMKPDGTGRTQITNDYFGRTDLSWSPDGTKLVFTSHRNNNQDIYVIDVDGTNEKRLTTHPCDDWSPTWSPDGTKIAFETFRDAAQEIYVMNPDGSGQTALVQTEASDKTPAWGPAPKEKITVTSPDGGESWTRGAPHRITWDQVGLTGTEVRIELYKGEAYHSLIVSSVAAEAGAYSWTIPSTIPTGSDYQIQVTSIDNQAVTDDSNGMFTITAPRPITVTSPNGGESWQPGSAYTVTWTQTGLSGTEVQIDLHKGGDYYGSVISSIAATAGYYEWTIPEDIPAGSDYVIMITSLFNDRYYDFSDGCFTIIPNPSITVISPEGGEVCRADERCTIHWSYTGDIGDTVGIFLLKNGIFDSILAMEVPIGTGGNGLYDWKPPLTQAAGDDYSVMVASLSEPAIRDTSNNPFSVYPLWSLKVISPNGGEVWQKGTTQTISWEHYSSWGANTAQIRLYKAGTLVSTITTTAPVGSNHHGSSSWTIPDTLADGDDYTIKVTTVPGGDMDDSDAPFTISSTGIQPLPGFSDPATDPDGDGIYEDLNANGRLDFADVVLYFNQMEWIADNEPIAAFDLNGNGRIDFADIVALFNEI